MILEQKTLEILYEEALENYNNASEEFDNSDCHEAMHEMETWDTVTDWLLSKMSK